MKLTKQQALALAFHLEMRGENLPDEGVIIEVHDCENGHMHVIIQLIDDDKESTVEAVWIDAAGRITPY